jgi:uncharacterized protein YceK
MLRRLILLLGILGLSGCATVVFEAPRGKELNLTSSQESTAQEYEAKIWYLIGGLVPITANSTARMQPGIFSMDKNPSTSILASCPDNGKVYFKSEIGIIDWLISAVAGSVLSTFTCGCGGVAMPTVYSVKAYCK